MNVNNNIGAVAPQNKTAFKGNINAMRAMYDHAFANKYAIAKINVTDDTTLNAVTAAARDTKTPVVLEFSESAIVHFAKLAGHGKDLIKGVEVLLRKFADADKNPMTVSHVDHGKADYNLNGKFGQFLDAWAANGGDSFMADGTGLFKKFGLADSPNELRSNLGFSKKAADIMRNKGVFSEVETDVLPGGASHNPDDVTQNVMFTTEKTAAAFDKEVNPDSVAWVVGFPHGPNKNTGVAPQPEVISRNIKFLRETVGKQNPRVIVHGASNVRDRDIAAFNSTIADASKHREMGTGTPDSVTQEAIKHGAVGFNTDTDTRLQMLAAMGQVDPTKVDVRPTGAAKFDAMYKGAIERFEQLGSLGKLEEAQAFLNQQ